MGRRRWIMLWLAFHFPQFPLETALRGSPDAAPAALGERQGNDSRILGGNEAAHACGIRPGMKVSAARALVQDLRVIPRDPGRERRALESLACWAGQFTPCVNLTSQALLLQIDGCLRLFHGVEGLCRQALAGLAELGYQSRHAVAATPLAALYFARTEAAGPVKGPEAREQLSALPIDVMLQPADILTQLQALGVTTLGALRRLPRSGVARRFGAQLLLELDRAFGDVPDPRRFFVPPERFITSLELPGEVWEVEGLLFAARRLLGELSGFLAAREAAVQRMELELLHSDGPATRLILGLRAPMRDPQHWLMVLREQLGRTELPQPVQGMTLRAEDVVSHAGRSGHLFDRVDRRQEEADRLLERLRARLGNAGVYGVACAAEHRPERAWQRVEPGRTSEAAPGSAPRPAWLLAQPVPLDSEDGHPRLGGRLEIDAGPERIESGWWDDSGVARDYYQASREGSRYWIYRDRRDGLWYWHGIFA